MRKALHVEGELTNRRNERILPKMNNYRQKHPSVMLYE